MRPSKPGWSTPAAGQGRGERLLILAEGFSGDPHYGKTARGVLAYGQRPVVAILDSTRVGESHGGVPIVGTVADALEATGANYATADGSSVMRTGR